MKEKKLTVIGTVDPVNVVSKLRKYWHTDIVSVGPAKEPEKEEETKPGGEQTKKEGGGGAGKEQRDPNEKPEGGDHQEQKPGDQQEGKNNDQEQPYKEGEERKKDDDQEKRPADPVLELLSAYRAYNPQLMPSYYYVRSMEENPNACSIC